MKKFSLSLMIVLYSTIMLAQEEETTKAHAEGSGAWYSLPWVWVLGAAVVIMLLVALTRGGSRKNE